MMRNGYTSNSPKIFTYATTFADTGPALMEYSPIRDSKLLDAHHYPLRKLKATTECDYDY